MIERLASSFIEAGIGPTGEGMVSVRAAEHGCLIVSRSITPKWLPAYCDPGAKELIDNTGASNTFLGGLVVGHGETGDRVTAAAYGVVSASLVVEQLGSPVFGGVDEQGRKLWNGRVPRERLREYLLRLDSVGNGIQEG
jgi:hypothetical protein